MIKNIVEKLTQIYIILQPYSYILPNQATGFKLISCYSQLKNNSQDYYFLSKLFEICFKTSSCQGKDKFECLMLPIPLLVNAYMDSV